MAQISASTRRLSSVGRHFAAFTPCEAAAAADAAPAADASLFDRAPERLPQLFMHRRTLDNLPPLEIPDGYSLRTFEPGDAEHWCAILNDTSGMGDWIGPDAVQRLLTNGPFGNMTKVSRDVGRDGLFEPTNLFFVIDPSGIPCATACAWTKQTAHGIVGELHMVSVKPGHRGKRLGNVVTVAVLHRFKELGFTSAHLGTDDWRVPAIRSYWSAGYEAEISHWSHNDRWHALERYRVDPALVAPNQPPGTQPRD
jgi:mycothiol synthase